MEEALIKEFIDKAVAREPKKGWPLALRAWFSLEENSSNLNEDLDKAVRIDPSAWVYRVRAEFHDKNARTKMAIEDLDKAIALSAPNPALHARKANCCFTYKR